jgi:predicted acylesterase/phospholipase RssA
MGEGDQRELYQELRLALVFNGGVSLAVWMGGVAKEVDRFRRALHTSDARVRPYRALLDVLRTEVVTDVVAGTSAGGINGALLGYVVANRKSLEVAGEDAIRDTWLDLGSIDELLNQQRCPPASALNDRFLFNGCAKVFKRLKCAESDLISAPRQLRLTVTTTDSEGYPITVGDVRGVDHRLEMRFRHVDVPSGAQILLSEELREAIAATLTQPVPDNAWPFPQRPSPRDLTGPDAAAFLTRAARSTASFPIAFAASQLPLDVALAPLGDDPTRLTGTPPMRGVVDTRGDALALDETPDRYVVDGGLWDNAPFEAVLRNIDRTAAGRDVDRRLVYIVATDENPPPVPPGGPPNLVKSVSHAVTMPSNVSFANDLERIEADIAKQRTRHESFAWLLADGRPDVFALAAELYPVYRQRVAEDGPDAAQVPPASLNLARGEPLEAWRATLTDWQWGIRPVVAAVAAGRRLMRDVLRELAGPDMAAVAVNPTDLVALRSMLSQLAWVLCDLQDRTAGAPLTPAELVVCGQTMHDFATAVAAFNETLVAMSAECPASEPLQTAARLTAGDAETVIKRAIATEICMHSLATDRRPHKVDYTFETIRPDDQWPAPDSTTPPPDQPKPRPPLAGASYGHFGGFLRTSWRLSDWMWGRLDGTTRVVDMLLDVAQVERLTDGSPSAINNLAAGLAAIAVPADDATSRADTHRLARAAHTAHDLLASGGAPETDPSTFENATAELRAQMVATWRDTLAFEYATALTQAHQTGDAGPLIPVRADLRRQLQLEILRDEIPVVLRAAQKDGACKSLRNTDLASEADGGLRKVVTGLPGDLPRLTLLQDGEAAAANTLDALGHRVLATRVRRMGDATHAMAAFPQAARVAYHYIFHRRPRRR